MNAREMRLGQLAMKGRILTPVSPLEFVQGTAWTRFTDIWAGGCAKEPWDYIFIQAPPDVACRVFEHVFEHDPHHISCACCGPEYEIAHADHNADYGNSLFIKDEDIVPEWTVPPGLVFSKEVIIKDEDIYESSFTKSKFGIDGTPKSPSDTDYEVLLQQNVQTLAAAFKVPEAFLSAMSQPALGKAAADFGDIPPTKTALKPKLIDPAHAKFTFMGKELPLAHEHSKDDLPAGMTYVYDVLSEKKKKK